MALTIDWDARIVDSDDSLLDIVAFKDALRDREDDADGMLHPPIITYKRLDLGGGAYQHAVDFINGYQLRFPVAGNYTVAGNVNATIVPVAGVFVERIKASAFVSGAGGAGGLTSTQAGQLASLTALLHQV